MNYYNLPNNSINLKENINLENEDFDLDLVDDDFDFR